MSELVRSSAIEVTPVGLEEIKASLNPEIHVNWQNTLEYVERLSTVYCYGVRDGDGLAAYLCVNKQGRVFQLWVEPSKRHCGIGSSLVAHAVKELCLSKVTVSMPNNASLEGFVRKLGFTADAIAQYEMYKGL